MQFSYLNFTECTHYAGFMPKLSIIHYVVDLMPKFSYLNFTECTCSAEFMPKLSVVHYVVDPLCPNFHI